MAMSGEGSLKRFHTWLLMSWPISPVMIHDLSLWLAPWGSLRLLGRYSDPYKEVSPHDKQIPEDIHTHMLEKNPIDPQIFALRDMLLRFLDWDMPALL